MKLWTIKHEASHPGPHMWRVDKGDVTDELVEEIHGRLAGRAMESERGIIRQVLEELFEIGGQER